MILRVLSLILFLAAPQAPAPHKGIFSAKWEPAARTLSWEVRLCNGEEHEAVPDSPVWKYEVSFSKRQLARKDARKTRILPADRAPGVEMAVSSLYAAAETRLRIECHVKDDADLLAVFAEPREGQVVYDFADGPRSVNYRGVLSCGAAAVQMDTAHTAQFNEGMSMLFTLMGNLTAWYEDLGVLALRPSEEAAR